MFKLSDPLLSLTHMDNFRHWNLLFEFADHTGSGGCEQRNLGLDRDENSNWNVSGL